MREQHKVSRRYRTCHRNQFEMSQRNIIQKRLMSFAFETTPYIRISCKLQSQPKVVGTLELYHVSPILSYKRSRFFPSNRGKKRLIIDIESGEDERGGVGGCRREFASCQTVNHIWLTRLSSTKLPPSCISNNFNLYPICQSGRTRKVMLQNADI